MIKEQILAQQQADITVVKFIGEIVTTGHIHEDTFDKTRDTTLECAKQNIEASSLSEREKKVAKDSIDKFVREIAQKFKIEMTRSGLIIKRQ